MPVGRALIALGVLLLVAGILITVGERLPFHFGRLPGDFIVRGKHTTFYFPLATCILVSVILSLILWLLRR